MKVLVIGNGFDLHHNNLSLKIKWEDFVKSKYCKEEITISRGDDWSDFENILFKQETKKKKFWLYNNISRYFEKWFDNEIIPKIDYAKIRKSNLIKKIIKNVDFVISLNYTKTIEIYGFEVKNFTEKTFSSFFEKQNFENSAINIHQFSAESKKGKKYIVGSDQENKYDKNWQIKKWNKYKPWNPKKVLIEKIQNQKKFPIDEFIFFGFSFGLSDSELVKFFFNFSNKNNAKLIIYYLNEESLQKIKDNIKNILNCEANLNTIFIKIT